LGCAADHHNRRAVRSSNHIAVIHDELVLRSGESEPGPVRQLRRRIITDRIVVRGIDY
jgi:hypothetical protein